MSKAVFSIPYYHDYISPALAEHLLAQAIAVPGVQGLKQVGPSGGLETQDALGFLLKVYQEVENDLKTVLDRRTSDRKFIDERVKACYQFNARMGRDFLDRDYQTILGLEDGHGRIVIGPKSANYCKPGGAQVAPIPEFLKGPHVTLFGPPDSAKMAINAMNAYHRKLKGEPAIVEELLKGQDSVPKWGADNEDSKTPLRADLIDAAVNLTACFEGNLSCQDTHTGKSYTLAKDHLAAPIKRFPGLALPCTFLFHESSPIPLHLYDFAIHLFHNWHNPKALVFYVPKLENEEEAQYIHKMIAVAEGLIKAAHPEYELGTVRLMIVLENPRAILRAHEIMDALYPYFLGASLGWHDYLGSTARLFKEDGNYRIPVKADPDIVIKYIKASHELVADVVGSRGGVKVGGMYGILPLVSEIHSESFQVTLKGFFKDVVTQMKRDLTGFWVAHPDFVRLGIAIVEAWRRYQNGRPDDLFTLTKEIFSPKHCREVDEFIKGPDVEGLDRSDPNYVRSLLVADIKESDFIPNNHPDEIRYNVFQSLQYLTDWLSGNGCVALPTTVGGEAVRIMDDLATAERSRWEVWHELYHGRFPIEEFLKIAHEEMHFIRKDLSDSKKIVQVKWDERTSKWYPIAFKIMLQLMTAKKPVEFATELLLPFTLDDVREAKDPWQKMLTLDPGKYHLESFVSRYDYFFEVCGVGRFASAMAHDAVTDLRKAENLILSFTVDEIQTAAGFHGNIGESKKTLDAQASAEQALVFNEDENIRKELQTLGSQYQDKFGIKFLISAKDKSGKELLDQLKLRLANTRDLELKNARQALWEITQKRLMGRPLDKVISEIEKSVAASGITGCAIALASHGPIQDLTFGTESKNGEPVTPATLFEIASLSKSVGSAFAIEYFREKNIPLSTPVNELLKRSSSPLRLSADENPEWGDKVTLHHLMNHSALNLHYVNGIPCDQKMPDCVTIMANPERFGYEPLRVMGEPGQLFHYSGAGFMVLEHVIEALEGKSIQTLTEPFLTKLGLEHLTFQQANLPAKRYASGYRDNGEMIPTTRLMFPAFAAGAMGTAHDVMRFLQHLGVAYHDVNGSGAISHDTAVTMLHGMDNGSREFMGCDMGLGIFVAEAGLNKIALHQGANDGFRAIYLYCVAGPDYGKGFVILCNADNSGVLFIARTAQRLLRAMNFSGIDFDQFCENFEGRGVKPEELVNQGYKNLVCKAFLPTLPEEIIDKGPLDPLSRYNLAVDAKILTVSNQRFARAQNLISPYMPKFDPELFGSQGKIMDSWETARHNPHPCDWLEMEFAAPEAIRFVSLSTKYHDGNQVAAVRLLGRTSSTAAWEEFLPKQTLSGHSLLAIKLPATTVPFKEVRVESYPDGGFSRLGLFADLPPEVAGEYQPLGVAKAKRFSEPVPKSKKPLTLPYNPQAMEIERNRQRAPRIDYASLAFGGRFIRATDEHFGPAAQVISPFPPLHMFDGLETARSRETGHSEEVILELAAPLRKARIVLDFTYFVNNNPLLVSIMGIHGKEQQTLVEKRNVKGFAGNIKEFVVEARTPFQQLIVRAYPDGGINRIHVYQE